MSRNRRLIRRRLLRVLVAAGLLSLVGTLRPAAEGVQAGSGRAAEQKLAAAVSETRMVETVRRLVGFGPRMYGTPSNHEAAAWLAEAFRDAGLEVTIRQDPPRAWYQPVAWTVRTSGNGTGPNGAALRLMISR